MAASGPRPARARPAGVAREVLWDDPVRLVLSEDHPAARRHRDAVPLAELRDEAWTTGHRESGWEEMTIRTCRQLGGFDPDIRHRSNDSVMTLALVAHGGPSRCCPTSCSPSLARV